MLPVPESFLLFAVAIWPLCFVHVVWHEAGHVLGAWLAGIPILAWGVGFQNPRIRLPLGGSYFYIGRPLTSGLTLHYRALFAEQRWPEFVTVLGGPLASLLGLVLGIVAWRGGIHNDILLAWIYLSGLYCLAAWIPRTFQRSGLTFDNDARLLLNLLTRGERATRTQPYGAMVSTQATLATLLDQIGHRPGAAYVRVAAANLAAGLGAVEIAQRWYDEAPVADLRELPTGEALRDFVRAAIAVEAGAEDAPQLLSVAEQACRGESTAEFYLAANRLQYQRRQGMSVERELQTLRALADGSGKPSWQALAALVEYESDPTIEPQALDAMLLKFERYLPDVSRASVLATAVERLALAGRFDEAAARYPAAREAILNSARFVSDPPLRAAYLARVSAPLVRAHELGPERIPEWKEDGLQPGQAPGPRPIFITVAFLLSLGLTSAAGTLFVCVNFLNRFPPESGRNNLVVVFSAAALISVVAAMLSLLRREGRPGKVLISVVLAFLSVVTAAATIDRLKQATHTELPEKWEIEELEISD